MAKKKIAEEVTATEVVETIETSTPEVVVETVTEEVAPVAVIASAVPTVEKQKGRPIVAGSVRQLKLAEQVKRIADGGKIERGRPTNGTSARQMRIAAKAALIAAGVKVGPGRPKVIKPEVVAEVTAPTAEVVTEAVSAE